MLLSSQVFITAWPGQALLDTSPHLLYAFICVGKWLMCFLPSFHTLLRVDVAGGCGFVTQSSQSDSLWLLREVVITYCPPTTAIVQIQIPVWSHQKSVQGVTPAYSCFLACFFFSPGLSSQIILSLESIKNCILPRKKCREKQWSPFLHSFL